MNRMLVISADCHASPKLEVYYDYLEKRYHSELELIIKNRNAEMEERLANANSAGHLSTWFEDFETRCTFATELEERLPILAEDGIAGEVIFPDLTAGNQIPFTGDVICQVGPREYMPEYFAKGLEAYNRWLGEHSDPDRQVGIAAISFHDPAYTLEQVKKARSLGLRGVMPQWDGLDPAFLPLHDEAFDPVWAACADDELPIVFHPAAGKPKYLHFGADTFSNFRPYIDAKHTIGSMVDEVESLWWCRRALWHMIFGGVLERHPSLQVGFVEMWVDWIPRTLTRLDYLYERAHGRPSKWESVCALKPTEYWTRQCFVGAHSWSVDDLSMRHALGVETFTYGTDAPHPNSPWKTLRPFLQATMGAAHVPEDEARLILGDNLVRIFGLDKAKLEAVAESIGPLPEEVLQVPEGKDPNDELSAYVRFTVNHPQTSIG